MRKPDKRQFEAGESFDIRSLDVTDPDSIKACVTSVLNDYGKIDILINNAGIHPLGAIEDMEDDNFRRVFETNFFGAVNLARAVLPSMRERRRGHIISISSIGSLVGRVSDGAYCASKAALEIVFEAMKYEVERFGIDVSVVCPSAFKTNIGRKFEMPENYASGSPYQELVAYRLRKVREAIKDGGEPSDVAKLIKQIADDPSPHFRYVVGDKAIQMQGTMTGLGDAERKSVIIRLAGIDWWLSGAEGPGE
jgi:NAD(P)-dependent dehydrogenase (short-subunit alcohol dehydrogenase family)